MVLITVPAGYAASPSSVITIDEQGNSGQGSTSAFESSLGITPAAALPQSYVFDAVIDTEHAQVLTKTMHPVQTSVSISSHAYLEPATLAMQVLMSDAVGSYNGGLSQTEFPYIQAWSGNSSKSVSAYLQMLALQALRVPLTVTTRLRTYYNMMILSIAPRETVATISGVRFRVDFGQIFVANVQATPISARPDDTQTNDTGTVNPQDVPDTTTTQFSVPQSTVSDSLNRINVPGAVATSPGVTTVNVPGAGDWTSAVQQFVGNHSSTFTGLGGF
jgi:hypothetical protein